jgi:Uma2 family endonuclease
MVLQTEKQITLQEFLNLPPGEGDTTYELVDGQIFPKMSPKKFHSRLTRAVLSLVEQWCDGKGEVFIELAIKLTRQQRDWVPTPDLLYISHERLPANWYEDTACPVAPDLVIEIISSFGFERSQSTETAKTATLSPGQTFGQMIAKAKDYLNAGVLRVWVVDSQARSITVFYPDAAPQTYMGEELVTDSLFPGWEFVPETAFTMAKIPKNI